MIEIDSNKIQHNQNIKKAYDLIDRIRRSDFKKTNPLNPYFFSSKKQTDIPRPFESLTLNLSSNAFYYMGELEFSLPISYDKKVRQTLQKIRLDTRLLITVQPHNSGELYFCIKDQILRQPYFVIKVDYPKSKTPKLSQCIMFGKELTARRKIASLELFQEDISNLFYITKEFLDAFYQENKPDFRLSMPSIEQKL